MLFRKRTSDGEESEGEASGDEIKKKVKVEESIKPLVIENLFNATVTKLEEDIQNEINILAPSEIKPPSIALPDVNFSENIKIEVKEEIIQTEKIKFEALPAAATSEIKVANQQQNQISIPTLIQAIAREETPVIVSNAPVETQKIEVINETLKINLSEIKEVQNLESQQKIPVSNRKGHSHSRNKSRSKNRSRSRSRSKRKKRSEKKHTSKKRSKKEKEEKKHKRKHKKRAHSSDEESSD